MCTQIYAHIYRLKSRWRFLELIVFVNVKQFSLKGKITLIQEILDK